MARKKDAAAFRRMSKPSQSRTMVDKASGKKVFSREYKAGRAMATKAAGGKGFGKQVAKMQARLTKLDAGKVKGRAGERSHLRGVMSVARKAAPAQAARSSGT
jgi:hypothetical protein